MNTPFSDEYSNPQARANMQWFSKNPASRNNQSSQKQQQSDVVESTFASYRSANVSAATTNLFWATNNGTPVTQPQKKPQEFRTSGLVERREPEKIQEMKKFYTSSTTAQREQPTTTRPAQREQPTTTRPAQPVSNDIRFGNIVARHEQGRIQEKTAKLNNMSDSPLVASFSSNTRPAQQLEEEKPTNMFARMEENVKSWPKRVERLTPEEVSQPYARMSSNSFSFELSDDSSDDSSDESTDSSSDDGNIIPLVKNKPSRRPSINEDLTGLDFSQSVSDPTYLEQSGTLSFDLEMNEGFPIQIGYVLHKGNVVLTHGSAYFALPPGVKWNQKTANESHGIPKSMIDDAGDFGTFMNTTFKAILLNTTLIYSYGIIHEITSIRLGCKSSKVNTGDALRLFEDIPKMCLGQMAMFTFGLHNLIKCQDFVARSGLHFIGTPHDALDDTISQTDALQKLSLIPMTNLMLNWLEIVDQLYIGCSSDQGDDYISIGGRHLKWINAAQIIGVLEKEELSLSKLSKVNIRELQNRILEKLESWGDYIKEFRLDVEQQ